MAHPFGQIDVKSEVEPGMLGRGADGLGGRRAVDHQARRGHDAVGVCAQDALVDAGAEPEVVGVDDQRGPRSWRQSPRSANISASLIQSCACSAGGVQSAPNRSTAGQPAYARRERLRRSGRERARARPLIGVHDPSGAAPGWWSPAISAARSSMPGPIPAISQSMARIAGPLRCCGDDHVGGIELAVDQRCAARRRALDRLAGGAWTSASASGRVALRALGHPAVQVQRGHDQQPARAGGRADAMQARE